MKKIFIISSVLLAVVLIFLGIYNFAFRDTAAPTTPPAKADTADTAKKPADTAPADDVAAPATDNADQKTARRNEVIISVSQGPVVAPTVDRDKNVIRFYRPDGTVGEVSIDGGSEKSFADKELTGFAFAVWAPDAQRVLTKFVDRAGARFYSFDHRTARGNQLKGGIDRVAWTAPGDQILYTYFDQFTRRTSLNVAKPDGSGWRMLADDVAKGSRFVHVPQSSRVAYWRAPNRDEEGRLSVVSLVDAVPRPKVIMSRHYNADYLFSPDGERILVSSTQKKGDGDGNRVLGVANANGGEYQNLQIPTNVQKCVWASNSRVVYCAFPTGERDTFWKIDVTTNKKDRIVDLDNVVTATARYQAFDLFLSPDGTSLFFVNRLDSRLYRIALQ